MAKFVDKQNLLQYKYFNNLVRAGLVTKEQRWRENGGGAACSLH